jgi:hypothetical protein
MLLLTGDQLKDYLIEMITFWTAEIKREDENLFTCDLREQEAFRWSYEDVYEKLFGVEEFKKVYQKIYDEVYKEI